MMFPGQGSQSVGMLSALGDAEPVVRETFEEASSVLGYDLWALCQQGPDARLGETERTQPAMLAAGIACWRSWGRHGGPRPAGLAGHSLGEYSALVAAGSLSLRDALVTVRRRGTYMQEAVPVGKGAMAAILGLDLAAIETACREAADGQVVSPANLNSPGQVVIAGDTDAVDRAVAKCKAAGAKRALRLQVSAPFHCALMKPAQERLEADLRGCPAAAPAIDAAVSAVFAPPAAPPQHFILGIGSIRTITKTILKGLAA